MKLAILTTFSCLIAFGQDNPLIHVNVTAIGPEFDNVCTPCPERVVANIDIRHPLDGSLVEIRYIIGFQGKWVRCVADINNLAASHRNYCDPKYPDGFFKEKEVENTIWMLMQEIRNQTFFPDPNLNRLVQNKIIMTMFKPDPQVFDLNSLFRVSMMSLEHLRACAKFYAELTASGESSSVAAGTIFTMILSGGSGLVVLLAL